MKIEAIIQSFTQLERRDPYALIREPSRVAAHRQGLRAAEPRQVDELVQKFLFMKQMMEGLGQNIGIHGQNPRDEERRDGASNMRKQMKAGGGFPGMPGMGSDARHGRLPGWGCLGWAGSRECPAWAGSRHGRGRAGDSMTKMRPLSTAEKNAKKAQRKREKDARRRADVRARWTEIDFEGCSCDAPLLIKGQACEADHDWSAMMAALAIGCVGGGARGLLGRGEGQAEGVRLGRRRRRTSPIRSTSTSRTRST